MNFRFTSSSEFVQLKAVQHRYSISRSTLYLWVANGRLPHPVKLGPRAVRFRAADLAAFEAQFASSAPLRDDAKASA